MQFVGRPFAEDAILSAGIAFERAASFGKRRLPALPAPTPALTL
jgi:Asp-tRNA(Asn)/Glu-tRNA(Gln) amidotransferase A subunit family amidase